MKVRVIRYVCFNLKIDIGSYFRENLMFFILWRNEFFDWVVFLIWKKVFLVNKNEDYKYNGDMFD